MTEYLALLMLITPPDLPIARYSIRALSKLLRMSDKVTVYLYCNGLNEKDEEEITAVSGGINSRVHIISNRQRLARIQNDIKIGDWYITDEGNREFREANYENCGEVWTREVVRLPTDIVGIIDADFEVLDPAFVLYMRDQFSNDTQLAFFSVDYGPLHRIFETYSQTDAYLAARFNTWFCLYRRSALEKYPNFTYVEETAEDGLPVKYDHSAKLQEILNLQYGYHGESLDGHFGDCYIHYGAFAQNRRLRGGRLWLYRLVRIGTHNGWLHVHRSWHLARIIKRLSQFCYRIFRLSNYDRERQRYLFEDVNPSAKPKHRQQSTG